MIINCMIIDLMIKFIKLVFLIYEFKHLINESSALANQREAKIRAERNRNFNISCTFN
jgi:hypothetical protein